ncbi:Rad17 cell cycle checkpoint protein [Rhizoctonia solani]|uniref:Rad17 cell cycle checkpoint protein n=1 Tax=Rhizoctonia solani TaxID=456999 RepID=A0A8H7M4L1_9AGAM|nr:Rad17 cell cycle checkpoint protein [Rhizoctonia solani]
MARKAAVSPTRVPRKRSLKRSTLSSDSLFGFGTQPPSGNAARQLSVPRFNLSQGAGLSSQVQVIDLTEDDQAPPPMSTPPIPGPPAKKPRRMSPSPLANPPKIPGTHESDASHSGESRDTTGDAESLPGVLKIYCRKLSLSILGRWRCAEMVGRGTYGRPDWQIEEVQANSRTDRSFGIWKTATLQILARELEAEVVEWQANSDEFSVAGDYGAFKAIFYHNQIKSELDYLIDYESATTKLASFLERAGVYGSLSLKAIRDSTPDPESKGKERRTEKAVPPSAAVSSLVYPPLVLIISDAGLRADDTSPYSSSHRDDVLDIRSVLPPALLGSHYVTQIKFNPVAATFMRKALISVISSHLSLPSSSNSKSKSHGLPKETIDALIEAANGDIRSAITGILETQTSLINSDPIAKTAAKAPLGIRKETFQGGRLGPSRRFACRFCDDIDECYGLADALSEADGAMGILDENLVISSALSQHTFQHIARSALLALPSPSPADRKSHGNPRGSLPAPKKEKQKVLKSVVLDAGGLLGKFGPKVVTSSVLFSQLKWDISGSQQADTLDEEESVTAGVDVAEADIEAMEKRAAGVGRVKEEKEEKGYLSDDDIDDF